MHAFSGKCWSYGRGMRLTAAVLAPVCMLRASQTVRFGAHHTWSTVAAADSLVKVSKTSATMPKYSQVIEYDRGEYLRYAGINHGEECF